MVASIGPDFHWHINIVEIKQGKVNRVLGERLAAGDTPETLQETLGSKSAQQARRMLRQQERLTGLSDIVHTGMGVDPRLGVTMRRTPDSPPTPGYQEELRTLIEIAAQTGQHLVTIDECLTLAAIRAEMILEPRLVSATHDLFHFANPGLPCLLGTPREEANGQYGA